MEITDTQLQEFLNGTTQVMCNYAIPDGCSYAATHIGPCPNCSREMFMCWVHLIQYLEFLDMAQESNRLVVCKMCETESDTETLRNLIREV